MTVIIIIAVIAIVIWGLLPPKRDTYDYSPVKIFKYNRIVHSDESPDVFQNQEICLYKDRIVFSGYVNGNYMIIGLDDRVGYSTFLCKKDNVEYIVSFNKISPCAMLNKKDNMKPIYTFIGEQDDDENWRIAKDLAESSKFDRMFS